VRAAVAIVVMLAACSDPKLSLRYRLTHGDSQQCFSDSGTVTTDCQDVTMLCDAYLSVRVLRPTDQDAPYISVCEPLIHPQRKLCGIAGIDLEQPAMPIPEQTLEVQMAVFPKDAIHFDPISGVAVCPRVEFGANGLPVPALPFCDDPEPLNCPSVPAIGGRAFYHPGDDTTVVDLGCTDLAELTDAEVCNQVTLVDVTATVADFDNLVTSVDKQVADRLSVGVGEPKFDVINDTHELVSTKIHELDPVESTSPSWAATLDNPGFGNKACLAVRDDIAEATTSLTCRGLDDPTADFDIPGVFLKKDVLSTMLGAIGFAKFPAKGGLVVGMVINENFQPIPGQTVGCNGCTVSYLSDDRASVVTGGTSMSGVFVTRDAPFGTTFTVTSSVGPNVEPVIGGIVEGKVTIVILQDKGSVVGGP